MVKHGDMGVTVIKEEICTHISPETEDMLHAIPGHMGKYWGQSGGRGVRRSMGQSLYCAFRGEEWARLGKQV